MSDQMSEGIVVKDAFFKKHMLIPSLLFILTIIGGTKTVVDKMEVEMSTVKARLDEYQRTHVTQDQLTTVLTEMRFKSDDPYRGADALRDLHLRDARLNSLEKLLERNTSDIHEITTYMRQRWGWQTADEKRGEQK